MVNNQTPQNPNSRNFDNLKGQIDYLEEKIRQAEMAASAKMDQAAPIRSIYKWKAPERIYEPKSQQWYTTVALITVVIVAYSALTGNYLLIMALIILLVLLYAMNTFPPKIVEHDITNKGISTFDKIFVWNKIESFWVSRRSKQYVVNIDLAERNMNRIILLIGEGDVNKIVQELVKRVDYINPGGTRQDILSKMTEGKHIPLTTFLDVFEEGKKRGIPPKPETKSVAPPATAKQ